MKHNFKEIAFMSIDWYQSVALRYDVLRKPLGLKFQSQELLGEIKERVFGFFVGDLLVCTANCQISDNTVKVRQVATRNDFQNLGIGSLLIRKIEEKLSCEGITRIEMHARKVSLNFYKKLGYSVTGDEFLEVKIPHFKIYKSILS